MPLKCKSLEMLRGANKQQSLCFHLKKPKPETKNQTCCKTHIFSHFLLTLHQGSSDRQSSEDGAAVGS